MQLHAQLGGQGADTGPLQPDQVGLAQLAGPQALAEGFAGSGAGTASRQQRQDPRLARSARSPRRLFLIRVPDGADGQWRAEPAAFPPRSPRRAIELQRGFGGVTEFDTADSLAERILRVEHVIYPRALALVASGAARLENGRVHILTGVNHSGRLISTDVGGSS